MFPEGIHRNAILIKFSQLLLLNLSPDFDTRLTIADTKKQFLEIFFMEGNIGEYIEMVQNFDYGSAVTTRQIQEDIGNLRKVKTQTKEIKA